ncbi:hypothetical protein BLNAU_22192 [Blattamonas nauphoetae]|uniref:Transposase n=1 Tax=Blattamonas nauphoetae TaxID=2049346 RepID=A0ABQ9WWV2_9EUKA|nr:hypothetical protein BLNAU_22192 [Blattamonas nauphoetae]
MDGKRGPKKGTLIVTDRPRVGNHQPQSHLYPNKTLKNVQLAIKNKTYSSAIQLKKDLKLPGSDRSFQRFLKANKIGLHKHHKVPPFQPHHIKKRFDFAREIISKGYLPELCLFDDEKPAMMESKKMSCCDPTTFRTLKTAFYRCTEEPEKTDRV